MRSLIVYSSKGGNTEKLAETVRDALPGETHLALVQDDPDPSGFALICVGFWLQKGAPDAAAAAYLEKLQGYKLFLFASHGAGVNSTHAEQAMQAARDLAKGNEVVGAFNCQGEVDPEFLAEVSTRPTPPPWAADAVTAVGHPDAADLQSLTEQLAVAVAKISV
jgi:flavodoxin